MRLYASSLATTSNRRCSNLDLEFPHVSILAHIADGQPWRSAFRNKLLDLLALLGLAVGSYLITLLHGEFALKSGGPYLRLVHSSTGVQDSRSMHPCAFHYARARPRSRSAGH